MTSVRNYTIFGKKFKIEDEDLVNVTVQLIEK